MATSTAHQRLREVRPKRTNPMPEQSTKAPEKPQNGLQGLKHLRHDIVSGIVVSLVSGSPPKKIYQPAYEWASLIAHRTGDVPEDEVEP